MDQSQNPGDGPSPEGKAVIKRRWAVVRKAGGGAALIAVAGTLALADPNDTSDPGQDGGSPGAQVSADS